MNGKLYGVGIGPGDPELLTVKALRIIRESDVIAVPGTVAEETVAYQIVKGAYPELDQKTLLAVPMPMTKDAAVLEEAHQKGTDMICNELDQGKTVAFLTLGDPTVYSTYIYVHKKIQELGYEVEIISGITSFCAVAARLNMSLVEKAEELHVIPSSYQIDEAMKMPGTKVLMKAGKKMASVKETLKKAGKTGVMIENCGMENEKIYRTVEEIPDSAGYYSLIIVKD
ncbi:MAG TPA: precorrin-2 C(20)-methyltransferase [Candidatus Blautia gallistercoris]|uniref:Precorrin-2 C(20)-methyltransferase n=1 Tax=Candidatus Blautia gallistercoris TaxID=2838490 RepID=A0A9D1WI94_9FIRM|nr:precorrin-2 C(20)-methyltransferase [Candidatus Blautia gallistercoris]